MDVARFWRGLGTAVAIGFVVLWLLPSVGLLVSSFRSGEQVANSGWWQALLPQDIEHAPIRVHGDEHHINGQFVIRGQLFTTPVKLRAWGTSSRAPQAYAPDDVVELSGQRWLTVDAQGQYSLVAARSQAGQRLPRIFATGVSAPAFSLDNYKVVLSETQASALMREAFWATLLVSIPATVLPLIIAACAAYALAWMEFSGRLLVLALVVGLLVVPLQLALVPVLKLHLNLGIGKGFVGVWLAHTGFGLPLGIYLLRNYMANLPQAMVDHARLDGASELQIFSRLILPISFPALAAFAIFQFLWTWNDLLVAKVFLLDASGHTNVMTAQIVELLGNRGGHWEVLAAAAGISLIVPLGVFFVLQRYLVRGLLMGADR